MTEWNPTEEANFVYPSAIFPGNNPGSPGYQSPTIPSPQAPIGGYPYQWPGYGNLGQAAPPPPQPVDEGISNRSTSIPSNKWKSRIVQYTLLSIAVLVINVLVTVWVIIRPRSSGISALYTGSCSASSRTVVWVHLAINVLSLALTTASSDCMQKLLSPTRHDVNEAHARGSWLNVGVASIKNFRAATVRQRTLYILLGLSSIPLTVIYNAAIFSGEFGNSYNYKVMGMTYLSEAASGTASSDITDYVPTWALGYAFFQNLTNADCIKAYAEINIRDRDNLILLTNQEDLNLYYNPIQGQTGPWQAVNGISGIPNWMCASSPDDWGNRAQLFNILDLCPKGTTVDTLAANSTNWAIGGYKIAYCLSHQVPEQCQVQASLLFLVIVVLCNIGKVAGMLMTIMTSRGGEPLLAIGDMAESFLQSPDQGTEGSCLLTVEDVKKNDRSGWGAKAWVPKRRYWAQAAGLGKFMTGVGLLLLLFILSIVFLARSVQILHGNGHSSSTLWTMTGSSSTFRDTLVLPQADSYAAYAIIANLPQLLITAIYLLYSNVLSSMLFNDQLASFSQHRRPLATTSPCGRQRKTPLLAIPAAYAIPLMAAWTLLHWLVSQSLYLASGKTIHNRGFNPLDYYEDLMGLGFSPLAILLSMLLLLFLISTLMILGFRRYPINAPFVGTNTLAIAAVCHAPAADSDAARGELMWGAVGNGEEKENGANGTGHCCLTTGHVTAPIEERLYA